MAKQTICIGDFTLESGEVIPDLTLAYHTFGEMNAARDNVILVCHPLTLDSDCGAWWSGIVGPGRVINTSEDFVICFNVLGGCSGSTGPEFATESQRGAAFPQVTIRDIARSQVEALHLLGISNLSELSGASMGGMIALEIALELPNRLGRLVLIASTAEHSAWRLGVTSALRQIIQADAATEEGAERGLRLARQIAVALYRSPQEFDIRFGRQRGEADQETNAKQKFLVEEYLEHHGEAITKRFSHNSYVLLSRAMELYDATRGRFQSRPDLFGQLSARTLVVGIASDMLYPLEEMQRFAAELHAEYATLNGSHGHDSFLVDQEALAQVLRKKLPKPRAHRLGVATQKFELAHGV